MNDINTKIPGFVLPDEVGNLIWESLGKLDQYDLTLKNGKTALYWHVVNVIHNHIDEDIPGTPI